MGASVSRSFNKSIARILKPYPKKFIGVATAPLQDVKLALPRPNMRSMDRLETTYDARAAAREKARRRPRECFGNFYFSLGADDSTLPDVAKRIGTNRLMIGSDYPHPDGTFPNTIQMLQAREGLTKQDIEKSAWRHRRRVLRPEAIPVSDPPPVERMAVPIIELPPDNKETLSLVVDDCHSRHSPVRSE